GRKEAEGIADRVFEPRCANVELDVPGFLARARLVEKRAREERRFGGSIARGGGWAGTLLRRRRWRHDRRSGGRGAVEILMERLEHAGGFLAARDAQVEPFLFLQKDRVGIVLAVVAALAAVLLAHGGHQAPAQRPPLRELHALGERHEIGRASCR